MKRAFLVVVLVTACGGSPTRPGSDLRYRTIALTLRNPAQGAVTLVFRDAARLREAASSYAPLPDVDFSREIVVFASVGTRPDGCYSAGVESVKRTARGATVAATEFQPQQGSLCACTLVITNPAVILAVERVDGPVEVMWTARPRACGS